MYPVNKASNRFSGIIWLGSPLHMDFIYLFSCQGKAPSAVLWTMTSCSLSSCFPLSALSLHTLITLESRSAKWCAFSWLTMLTALFIFLVLGIKSRASWVSEKCSALHYLLSSEHRPIFRELDCWEDRLRLTASSVFPIKEAWIQLHKTQKRETKCPVFLLVWVNKSS